MKKYNQPTDDFFRELLKDHTMTPSEEARKAFLREVMAPVAPVRRKRNGLIILAALLLIGGAGILIWALSHPKQSTSIQHNSTPISDGQKTSSLTSSNNMGSTSPHNTTSTTANRGSEAQPPVRKKNTRLTDNQHIVKSASINGNMQPTDLHKADHDSDQRKYILNSPALLVTGSESTNQQPEKGKADSLSLNAVLPPSQDNLAGTGVQEFPIKGTLSDSSYSLSTPLTSKTTSSDTTVKLTSARDYTQNRSWSLSIGGYYTPEWMFNTLEGSKFIQNFGLEGTFRMGRFSVRTGAGFSTGKGTNELVVEYNDFLGTYNKLDSMKFDWSDPIKDYIPTIYTSRKDVWDSLMKMDYPKVIKRYTYLQIPMILGYDFLQSENFSVGARLGPVLSVLLMTKQLSAQYDPGNKKIIGINDISPEQINLNWQIMAGIGACYIVNRVWRFEVEPSVRYYFNSVYEKPMNNAKPWSVGIRAAISVDL